MRAAGIICEYNPFHAGHKKQIDFLRSQGFDCVICVMSGNFTQRGDAAIYDKYTRAHTAIVGGADLVLELPYPHSSLSAEGFSRSGISILERLSEVEAVCFGHECENAEALFTAAEICRSREFAELYADKAKKGGGTRAFFDTLAELKCDFPFSSNDILGISYIKALLEFKSNIRPIPIKREGTAYRSDEITDEHNPSASGIRKLIYSGNVDSVNENMVPKSIQKVIKNSQNLPIPDTATALDLMLPFFKFNTPELIRARAVKISEGGHDIACDGCGLLERLCHSAVMSSTLSDALSATYSTAYTDARVRRVMLAAYFGVTEERTFILPEYTTLLAANDTGRAFISETRRTRRIPIVTKPADAPCGIQKTITSLADSVYAYAMARSTGMAIPQDLFVKCKPYMALTEDE